MLSVPDSHPISLSYIYLSRVLAFQKLYDPGKKQVKDRLTRELIVQLVLQHLYVRGLHGTLKIMEQETGIQCTHSSSIDNIDIKYFYLYLPPYLSND